jgi:predicted Zn-dependent peptidase
MRITENGPPRAVTAAGVAITLIVVGCATTEKKPDERRVGPTEGWRATPPAVADVAPKPYAQSQLKSGLLVLVEEDPTADAVEVTLTARAGRASVAAKEAGLPALAWRAALEGAGTSSQLAMANALDALGGARVTVDSERGAVTLLVAPDALDRALELLSMVAKKPTFAAADIERLRSVAVGNARTAAAEEALLFERVLYGAEHPYGAGDGTADGIAKLSAARVKKFFADHVGPKNAALIVRGAVTTADVQASADKHLGKWTGAGKEAKPPPPKPPAALQLAFAERASGPLATLHVGRAVAKSGDADEAALQVALVLAEDAVRAALADQGAAVQASVQPRRVAGPWRISVSLPRDAAVAALAPALAALDGAAAAATDDAVARARDKARRRALVHGALSVDAVLAAADRDRAAADSALAAVTAEQAKAALSRAWQRADAVVLVVGDGSLASALEGAGLGAVVRAD